MAARRDRIQRSSSVGVALALRVGEVPVEDEEAVGVPERLQELAHRLGHGVHREAVAVPRLLRGEVVPAQRVRAVRVDHVPRHDHVALRLGHLLALAVEDQAEAEHRAVGGLPEENRGHGEQRVEPAARLVERLADVVGREALPEPLLVLERRVPLGEGHAARVPPHVDQVGHAAHALAALAAQDDLVDVGPVQVVGHHPPALLDLGARAHADHVTLVAAPDRQAGAPVALARESPVHVVLEPVAEAPVLDVVGVPLDRLVGREQLVLDLGGAHVPVGLGVVDERRAAAPAVRVGVLVLTRAEQAAGLAQSLDDLGVGVAHVHARERAGAVVEGAVGAHRVVDRQSVVLRQPEVVLAEGGAGVHHAGAVLHRHEVAGQDRVAALAVVGDVRERRLVPETEQGRARHPLLDLGVLAEHPLHQCLGEDQAVVTQARPGVLDVRVYRDRGVRHERPGHRGPGEQRDRGVVEQREPHVHRRVHHVLVSERHLVRRERGAVARAVGHDLVALGQEALVPGLLQRPPDRLDVVVREREVGVVGVDPEADPLGERVPLVDVAQHGLAALGVELGHAVALDVGLRLEAELLLDLELHRQPVTVPSALAGDEVAAHRLEAREHVLEDAAQNMVDARTAVGGGRALVEHEPGAPSRRRIDSRNTSRSRQRASTCCSRSGNDCAGSTGW